MLFIKFNINSLKSSNNSCLSEINSSIGRKLFIPPNFEVFEKEDIYCIFFNWIIMFGYFSLFTLGAWLKFHNCIFGLFKIKFFFSSKIEGFNNSLFVWIINIGVILYEFIFISKVIFSFSIFSFISLLINNST